MLHLICEFNFTIQDALPDRFHGLNGSTKLLFGVTNVHYADGRRKWNADLLTYRSLSYSKTHMLSTTLWTIWRWRHHGLAWSSLQVEACTLRPEEDHTYVHYRWWSIGRVPTWEVLPRSTTSLMEQRHALATPATVQSLAILKCKTYFEQLYSRREVKKNKCNSLSPTSNGEQKRTKATEHRLSWYDIKC